MKKLLPVLAFLPLFGISQNLPEQDCINALPVCGAIFHQIHSYAGVGNVDDLLLDTVSCLENDENNSVWYTFTVDSPGVLEFTIIPKDTVDDYDFALFDLTNASCADIGVLPLEVRCNYSGLPGKTGLQTGYTNATEPATGFPFSAPLNVAGGETYALLIDQFSSSPFGYTIDFSSSTVSFLNRAKAFLSDDTLTCDKGNKLKIAFTSAIQCSSISANGSEFEIAGPQPVTISDVISVCVGGKTKTVMLIFDDTITTSGNYELRIKAGNDGNIFFDQCGGASLPDTLNFWVPHIVKAAFDVDGAGKCVGDPFTFSSSSSGNFISLSWNFGDSFGDSTTVTSHTYLAEGKYTVQHIVNSSQCSDTAVMPVFAGGASVSFAQFEMSSDSACAGDEIKFTADTSETIFSYTWKMIDSTFSGKEISAFFDQPGIYNVCLKISNGCAEDSTCNQLMVKDCLNRLDRIIYSAINLFPNPAKNLIRIEGLPFNLSTTIEISDAFGRSIFKRALKIIERDFEISVSGLREGTYFLKISNTGSSTVRKFTVLH